MTLQKTIEDEKKKLSFSPVLQVMGELEMWAAQMDAKKYRITWIEEGEYQKTRREFALSIIKAVRDEVVGKEQDTELLMTPDPYTNGTLAMKREVRQGFQKIINSFEVF